MADINYTIGVNADVSSALNSLKSLQALLLSISSSPIDINNASLVLANKLATELLLHINGAINKTTGNLDLSVFSRSLKESGTSLLSYRLSLEALGPAGRQTFLSLSNAIASAEAPTNRLNERILKFGKTLKNTINWQLSSSIIHGLVGQFLTAINYAERLNKSLNNILIVTGHSNEQLILFAKQANEAARRLNTTTTEYTNASLIYYQLGLSDKEVAARVETTLKMANVTRQSALIVSDLMTAIWNNFADGTDNLEHYADVITALGAATASSSTEIAKGLEKFAAVADTIGLSYENATAALATIVATTRNSADSVGTGLRTLFSRLLSLKLGKTLEDGVGLSKYSAALETVGVNVLDAVGNLRNMDDILDDLGAKWNTISKALQVALALTVGGVRQYTNLIALMDNYDFYKENLEIAKLSDGTLLTLAARYALSWEAARDKVKASAEGIYDSLIDDLKIIKLTNVFSLFLDIINGIVSAFGGLGGIVTAVSAVMLNSFAKEMPSVLRDLGANFSVFTRKATKDMHKLLDENTALLTLMRDTATSDAERALIDKTLLINKMNLSLSKNQGRMSLADLEKYRTLMMMAGLSYDNLIRAAELVDKSSKSFNEAILNSFLTSLRMSGKSLILKDIEQKARDDINRRIEESNIARAESRTRMAQNLIAIGKRYLQSLKVEGYEDTWLSLRLTQLDEIDAANKAAYEAKVARIRAAGEKAGQKAYDAKMAKTFENQDHNTELASQAAKRKQAEYDELYDKIENKAGGAYNKAQAARNAARAAKGKVSEEQQKILDAASKEAWDEFYSVSGYKSSNVDEKGKKLSVKQWFANLRAELAAKKSKIEEHQANAENGPEVNERIKQEHANADKLKKLDAAEKLVLKATDEYNKLLASTQESREKAQESYNAALAADSKGKSDYIKQLKQQNKEEGLKLAEINTLLNEDIKDINANRDELIKSLHAELTNALKELAKKAGYDESKVLNPLDLYDENGTGNLTFLLSLALKLLTLALSKPLKDTSSQIGMLQEAKKSADLFMKSFTSNLKGGMSPEDLQKLAKEFKLNFTEAFKDTKIDGMDSILDSLLDLDNLDKDKLEELITDIAKNFNEEFGKVLETDEEGNIGGSLAEKYNKLVDLAKTAGILPSNEAGAELLEEGLALGANLYLQRVALIRSESLTSNTKPTLGISVDITQMASSLMMLNSAFLSATNVIEVFSNETSNGLLKFGAALGAISSSLMSAGILGNSLKGFANANGKLELGKLSMTPGVAGLIISAATSVLGLIIGGFQQRSAEATKTMLTNVSDAQEANTTINNNLSLAKSFDAAALLYRNLSLAVNEGMTSVSELIEVQKSLYESSKEIAEAYKKDSITFKIAAGDIEGALEIIDEAQIQELLKNRTTLETGLKSAGNLLIDFPTMTRWFSSKNYSNAGIKDGEYGLGLNFGITRSLEKVEQDTEEFFKNYLSSDFITDYEGMIINPNVFTNLDNFLAFYDLLKEAYDVLSQEEDLAINGNEYYTSVLKFLSYFATDIENYRQLLNDYKLQTIQLMALGESVNYNGESYKTSIKAREVTDIFLLSTLIDEIKSNLIKAFGIKEGTDEYDQMMSLINKSMELFGNIINLDGENLVYLNDSINGLIDTQKERFGAEKNSLGEEITDELLKQYYLNLFKKYGSTLFEVGKTIPLIVLADMENVSEETLHIFDYLDSLSFLQKVTLELEVIDKVDFAKLNKGKWADWLEFEKSINKELYKLITGEEFILEDFYKLSQELQEKLWRQYRFGLEEANLDLAEIIKQEAEQIRRDSEERRILIEENARLLKLIESEDDKAKREENKSKFKEIGNIGNPPGGGEPPIDPTIAAADNIVGEISNLTSTLVSALHGLGEALSTALGQSYGNLLDLVAKEKFNGLWLNLTAAREEAAELAHSLAEASKAKELFNNQWLNLTAAREEAAELAHSLAEASKAKEKFDSLWLDLTTAREEAAELAHSLAETSKAKEKFDSLWLDLTVARQEAAELAHSLAETSKAKELFNNQWQDLAAAREEAAELAHSLAEASNTMSEIIYPTNNRIYAPPTGKKAKNPYGAGVLSSEIDLQIASVDVDDTYSKVKDYWDYIISQTTEAETIKSMLNTSAEELLTSDLENAGITLNILKDYLYSIGELKEAFPPSNEFEDSVEEAKVEISKANEAIDVIGGLALGSTALAGGTAVTSGLNAALSSLFPFFVTPDLEKLFDSSLLPQFHNYHHQAPTYYKTGNGPSVLGDDKYLGNWKDYSDHWNYDTILADITKKELFNYINRPKVTTKSIYDLHPEWFEESGIPNEDDISTLFSVSLSSYDGRRHGLFTNILSDGSILSDSLLLRYIDYALEGKGDKNNLPNYDEVVLGVYEGGMEVAAALDEVALTLHEQHAAELESEILNGTLKTTKATSNMPFQEWLDEAYNQRESILTFYDYLDFLLSEGNESFNTDQIINKYNELFGENPQAFSLSTLLGEGNREALLQSIELEQQYLDELLLDADMLAKVAVEEDLLRAKEYIRLKQVEDTAKATGIDADKLREYTLYLLQASEYTLSWATALLLAADRMERTEGIDNLTSKYESLLKVLRDTEESAGLGTDKYKDSLQELKTGLSLILNLKGYDKVTKALLDWALEGDNLKNLLSGDKNSWAKAMASLAKGIIKESKNLSNGLTKELTEAIDKSTEAASKRSVGDKASRTDLINAIMGSFTPLLIADNIDLFNDFVSSATDTVEPAFEKVKLQAGETIDNVIGVGLKSTQQVADSASAATELVTNAVEAADTAVNNAGGTAVYDADVTEVSVETEQISSTVEPSGQINYTGEGIASDQTGAIKGSGSITAEGPMDVLVANGKGTARGTNQGKSGGGGGGGGKRKKKDHKKPDVATRYHTIKEHKADNERNKAEVERKKDRAFGAEKISLAEKEIELLKLAIDLLRQYLDEINSYLPGDKNNMLNALTKLKINVEFDADGVILNYRQIEEELLRQENELIDSYNNESIDDEAYEEALKKIDEAREYIKIYEDTLNLYEELMDLMAQMLNEIADLALELTKTKVEIKIDVDDDTLKLLEYRLARIEDNAYKTAKAISLIGDKTGTTIDKIKIWELGLNDLFESHGLDINDINNWTDLQLIEAGFTQNEMDWVRELRDNMIDAALEIVKARQEMLDMLTNNYDTLYERVTTLYDLFDHYNSVLDNYKNITDLMGRTMNKDLRNLIQNLNRSILANQRNLMAAAKATYEELLKLQEAAQKHYNDVVATGDKEAILLWEAVLNNVNEKVTEAHENWLSSWNEAVQTARDNFEYMLEGIIESFNEAMAGAFGNLDYLSDAFGRKLQTDELYLQDYDRLYELSKLQKDLNKTLSDTRGLENRKALLALQREINELQASGVRLSQYDVDALRKRYELEQAYADLLDSQDAKHTVRLLRNNEGMWGYVYTVDEDAVAEAEQNYEDKLHEYQQLNDDYIKELQSRVLETLQTYRDTLQEIMTDTTLTDEQREARINELNDWLLAEMYFFELQLNNAMNNLHDTLTRYYNAYEDTRALLIDSWTETNLSLLTNISSMLDYMTNWSNATEELLSSALQALHDSNEEIAGINKESGVESEDYAGTIAEVSELIATSSEEIEAAVALLAEELNEEFLKALDMAIAKEEEWNSAISSTADRVDSLAESLNTLIDRLTTLESFDVGLVNARAKYQAAQNSWRQGTISEADWHKAELEWHDYLDNWMAKFDEGGYTGAWGSGGKMAILHERENVFNKDDTLKLLDAAKILRIIDLLSSSMIGGIGALNAPTTTGFVLTLEQLVTISAEFPNVTDHYEIEEAFNNLVNKATQYANEKRNG